MHPSIADAAKPSDMLTRAKLEQQEMLISSLQKQLDTIANQIQAPPTSDRPSPADKRPPSRLHPSIVTPSADTYTQRATSASDPQPSVQHVAAPLTRTTSTPHQSKAVAQYSPELAQLLKFVDEIK
eukprot:GILI01007953.1.p1 GENE.GILI01007953.1~~GILI01007953.1.p1  ORF type:complete len:142 (+),score=21.21 GILI01007953.1:51-428(+)